MSTISTRTASSGAMSISSLRHARTNYFQPAEGRRRAAADQFQDRRRGRSKACPSPSPSPRSSSMRPMSKASICAPDRIARGGIRWSDRPEDFRTEVLGLAKAQNVKNAVIVPVGAKGGFVPEAPQDRRQRAMPSRPKGSAPTSASSRACSTSPTISRAMTSCRPPIRCGATATIPISSSPPTRARRPSPTPPTAFRAAHGFWLDDAFASGGSAGYDHKKMGITARGGWEAVKRHFREMDIDIQSTPFTVIGVGDMSGDVFGNGMLLSRKIRLLAAFDHRDIFIDPDPDHGSLVQGARAAVRAAALELAGLRQVAHLQGRRRYFRARSSPFRCRRDARR